MITLPNGCRCSELKVNPKNWESPKASVRKNWFIYYRFYDPNRSTEYPTGKLRIVKGMNKFSDRSERQEAVRKLMEVELRELTVLGFNPITSKHLAPAVAHNAITPETPFLQALRMAFEEAGYNNRTKTDIRSILNYVGQAAVQLQLDYIAIKEINPSSVLQLLDQCGQIRKYWSNNSYNVYIKYLSIPFANILQYVAIEFNPARGLRKKKTIKTQRAILTPEECRRIDEFTKRFDERLRRFIHIFFHSDSRTTEILRVQGEHVDLVKQKVKYLVLKGQQPEWVERTIKDIALPLWKAALVNCGPRDFVFSVGLKPGGRIIREEQISTRWRMHIKQKLGKTCDFYSLKHLNSDQTSAILGLGAAASHNGHKSIITTKKYPVNETLRVHEELKKLSNHFTSRI